MLLALQCNVVTQHLSAKWNSCIVFHVALLFLPTSSLSRVCPAPPVLPASGMSSSSINLLCLDALLALLLAVALTPSFFVPMSFTSHSHFPRLLPAPPLLPTSRVASSSTCSAWAPLSSACRLQWVFSSPRHSPPQLPSTALRAFPRGTTLCSPWTCSWCR